MKEYEIRSAFTSHLLFQIFCSFCRASLLINELLFPDHIFPKFFLLSKVLTDFIRCSFSKAKKISSRVDGKIVECGKKSVLLCFLCAFLPSSFKNAVSDSVKWDELVAFYRKWNVMIGNEGLKYLPLWSCFLRNSLVEGLHVWVYLCSCSSFWIDNIGWQCSLELLIFIRMTFWRPHSRQLLWFKKQIKTSLHFLELQV